MSIASLEEQFFDAFDLGTACCTDHFLNPCNFKCDKCEHAKFECPQITSDILLELMCIYARKHLSFTTYSENASDLKHSILSMFIENAQEFKQQVQELFKENK